MTFRHGVYIQELDTKLYAIRTVDSALPFVVGLAPKGPANEAKLVFNYPEFITTFGAIPSGATEDVFGLNQFARVMFTQYGMGPGIFVNVLDPEVHKTAVADESKTFADGGVRTDHAPLVGPVVVKKGETTFLEGADKDYTVNRETGVVTRVATGAILAADAVQLSYSYVDPSKVTAADIVGTVDAATGKSSGLELIEKVFPFFGKIPGFVVCPGWSHELSVAVAMIGKAEDNNGHFKSMAVIDAPANTATPTEAKTFKDNFRSPYAAVCWPRVKGTQPTYDWLSCHFVGVAGKTDYGNGDIPYESPSNKEILATSPEKILTLTEANYLNEQGIVTVHRMMTGWKLWGNRTACYPEVTDIKDAFIPCRRMADWIENNLIVSTWQKVDDPMNRRLIETVVDSTNIWLNGLVGRQYLLGARVGFLSVENPVTDLANGTIRFHIWYLCPPPAETIEFVMEVDVSYFSTLFSE